MADSAKEAFFRAERHVFRQYELEPSGLRLELEAPRVALRLLDIGAGESVVFLHGISLSSAHWAPIVAGLESRRCILLDMPGHGGSGAVDFRDLDLRRWHSDMLIRLLDELKLPSAHIVGHSYGGMIGMWLALDAPARVSSVVSIGAPSIAFGARPDFMLRTLAAPGLGPLMLKTPMPGVVHRSLLARSLGREALKAASPELLRVTYLGTRRRGFATTTSTYLREQFRGMRATPQRYQLQPDELTRIAPPILIVWGDHDTSYQSVEQGEHKASLIPRARFEVVPGGHEPWLDDPEACSRTISRFLEKVRPSAVA